MAKMELIAEVTGSVWKVLIEPGQKVDADEAVVLIESMKMEIPVACESSGVLVELKVAEGDAVEEGQVIGIVEV
ncbi:biotin/lipoyl-binding carrier protein [Orrella sp. 11846]|uniref:biotin/lipoyl-binding carrier protein n=1 Tax=Orrella sp. 11846 TaxID=3409913 RepID=UPI003B5B4F61